MRPSAPGELERFHALVERHFGHRFTEDRMVVLDQLLRERARVAKLDPATYLDRLEDAPEPDELRAVAGGVTIGETYFFRGAEHFEALQHRVLPELMARRSAQRRLRILSAGCASGEEPYSLAMLMDRLPALRGWDVELRGVDVNPAFLERARGGLYSRWSLRDVKPAIVDRYFSPRGNLLEIDPEVRRRVRFEERNMLEPSDLFEAGSLDLILCRNVTIYFPAEVTKALIARMARALEPDGFLFLGYTETLRNISQDFELHHTHGAFYYRRRMDGADLPSMARDRSRSSSEPPERSTSNTDWVQNIREAARRIEQLETRGARTRSPEQARVRAMNAREEGHQRALLLFKEERFDEALAQLDSGADDLDAEHLLLKAVLLTNRGSLDRAKELCHRLLQADPLSAEAYYLLALCYEQQGDSTRAIARAEASVYLNPDFSMAHLHLGLIHKRSGDASRSRHHLELAARLIERESPAHLMLFGGGFTREGLLGLCRSELRSVKRENR